MKAHQEQEMFFGAIAEKNAASACEDVGRPAKKQMDLYWSLLAAVQVLGGHARHQPSLPLSLSSPSTPAVSSIAGVPGQRSGLGCQARWSGG